MAVLYTNKTSEDKNKQKRNQREKRKRTEIEAYNSFQKYLAIQKLIGNIVCEILRKYLNVCRKRTNGIDGTSYQRIKIKIKNREQNFAKFRYKILQFRM
jgi:intergrase/recombinase